MFQESSVALSSPVEVFTNAHSGRRIAPLDEQGALLSLQEPAFNTPRETPGYRNMPPEAEGIELMNKFFRNARYLCPSLHEGLFKERYRSMLVLLRILGSNQQAGPMDHEAALLRKLGPNSTKTCLDRAAHTLDLVHATDISPGSDEVLGA